MLVQSEMTEQSTEGKGLIVKTRLMLSIREAEKSSNLLTK